MDYGRRDFGRWPWRRRRSKPAPELKTVPAIDLSRATFETGNWYAFILDGRRFFAAVDLLSESGWCVLTEIPDPYICAICGEPYQTGRHATGSDAGAHEYEARGAP